MKTLLSLLTLSLGLSAFAAPVPEAELARVNEAINVLASASGDEFGTTVSITSAERDDNGLLTSANLIAKATDATLSAGISAKNGEITLTAGAKINVTQFGIGAAELLALAPVVQAYIDTINQEGTYRATLTLTPGTKGITAVAELVPANAEAPSTVKRVLITALIPADTVKNPVELSVSATVNAGAETVTRAQTALSNIFNALARGEAPAEADIAVLSEILEQILNAL